LSRRKLSVLIIACAELAAIVYVYVGVLQSPTSGPTKLV
jgi:hypothetical protein